MTDIEKAKSLLKDDKTCVLVKGDKILISNETGIKPMMKYISEGINLNGFSVADKIVGKAAAMLFRKAGIKEVFAEVLSESALSFLNREKIKFTHDTLTEKIINRDKTGICPMEETVLNIDDFEKGYQALKEKIRI